MNKNFTKNQKISFIISICIIVAGGSLFFSNIIQPALLSTQINSVLILIAIGILCWNFKIPSVKINMIIQYLSTLFPAILAFLLINMIHTLQQFPEFEATPQAKDLHLFEVGLWFVILSAIGALVAMGFSDSRLKRLEDAVFPVKEIPADTINKTKKSEWNLEKISHVATIGGTIIALVLFGYTLQEIKSSENQLNEAKNAVNALKDISEKNGKEIDALNKTSTEISHQTAINAYVNGGNHTLLWEKCYDENTNDYQDGPITKQYLIVWAKILNEHGLESPVNFYGYFDFKYIGYWEEYNKGSTDLGLDNFDLYLIDPSVQSALPKLNLTKIFIEAEKQKVTKMQVIAEPASIAPYSPAIHRIMVGYFDVGKNQLLAEYVKDENGIWSMTTNENALCKDKKR